MKIALISLLMAGSLTPPPVPVTPMGPAEMERVQKMEFAEASARRVYMRGCGTDAYTRLTAKYALRNGIPANVFAALVVVESTCRPRAVSPEHAIGLAQIIPSHHGWVSRKVLYDPERNLEIGSGILGENIARWGLRKGLENYNGGFQKEEYADKILKMARS